MKNTTIQKLINDMKTIVDRGHELTNKGFISILEGELLNEQTQIEDAFNAGVNYANGGLQTFDYPESRYYYYTYKNPI